MTEQAHVGAPVLEAENLSIQFGGLKALQELSFSIPEKTVFSIIGPNGAGKTTFFNIVTGIYRPTAAMSASTARASWGWSRAASWSAASAGRSRTSACFRT